VSARAALILFAIVALLVAAPAAVADDQGIYDAWIAHDSEFAQLSKDFDKGMRSWEKSGYKKPGKAYAAIDKTRKLLAQTNAEMKAQQSSSAKGAEAGNLALKSNSEFDAALAKVRKAVKYATAGSDGKASAAFEDADALFTRSLKYEKRARKAFKAAGVAIKSR
jgi:hypothetical protein